MKGLTHFVTCKSRSELPRYSDEMRHHLGLGLVLLSAIAVPVACGTKDPGSEPFGTQDGSFVDGARNDANGFGFDGAPNGDGGALVQFSKLRIDPTDATLTVTPGTQAKRTFKVLGSLNGGPEIDLTDRFVFYVPDNFLVAGFPLDGRPELTTRLPNPADPNDPPQRGGKVTVQALGVSQNALGEQKNLSLIHI